MQHILIQLNQVGQCSSSALDLCLGGTSLNVAQVSGYCDLDLHGLKKHGSFFTQKACICWDIL